MENKQDKLLVGLIVVFTGKYKTYMERFVETFKKNFCGGNANLYIFTDGEVPDDPRIIKIPVKHLGWPTMPLLRPEMLYKHRHLFKNEYLYTIDGDVYFKEKITQGELTGDLVGTLHRNLERPRVDFNYEKRKESTAYVSPDEGEKYFACGLYGGNRVRFFDILRIMSENIRKDINKGIRAVWGDESHINRYFIDHPPTKILSPIYMCPENNTKFNGKIIHYHKDFKKINIEDTKNYETVNQADFENIQFSNYKILVTGHKGYIGSRLVRELKKNYQVFGMDLKVGHDILYGEFPKVDIVIHLAAQAGAIPSMENPMWDARNNIMATLKIIEQYPDAKIIFPTSGAATDPQSPYGVTKRACEDYFRILHKNYVVLRLSSIFGEKDRGVVDNFIRDEKPTIFGDGQSIRDFVHVNDIVRGMIHAIDWNIGLYCMGSGIGTKVIEIAEATGKKIYFSPDRPGELKEVVLENNTPDWRPTIDPISYVKSKCNPISV